jgi:hypothetical protein
LSKVIALINNNAMTTLAEAKNQIFDYVRYSLGDGLVDVELDTIHYETAIIQALAKYRQRSSNSVEESYSFLELQMDTNTYTLPKEVITVRNCYKRNIGANSGTSSQYEPFEAGFVNFYMIQSGRVGGLATYAFYSMFLKEAAKMFGGFLNFQFNTVTKQLTIMRRPRADKETILLWTENYKPDLTILSDTYSQPWIKDYTLALCMRTLGQGRGKFASLPGPQGGTTMNGSQLLTDANSMIEKLELELRNFVDNQTPAWFVIG